MALAHLPRHFQLRDCTCQSIAAGTPLRRGVLLNENGSRAVGKIAGRVHRARAAIATGGRTRAAARRVAGLNQDRAGASGCSARRSVGAAPRPQRSRVDARRKEAVIDGPIGAHGGRLRPAGESVQGAARSAALRVGSYNSASDRRPGALAIGGFVVEIPPSQHRCAHTPRNKNMSLICFSPGRVVARSGPKRAAVRPPTAPGRIKTTPARAGSLPVHRARRAGARLGPGRAANISGP